MRRFSFQLAAFTSLPDLKVSGGKVRLPDLDYPVEQGIKPVISSHQLDLHYNKHHKAYVDKFNGLNANHYDNQTVFDVVKKSQKVAEEKTLFNQIAQHFNHSFFWKCLTPGGTDKSKMPDDLKSQIEKDFGSVDAFKDKFKESGVGNFGSGWTWLVYDINAKKLSISNTSNAGCPIVDGDNIIPLFTADVWEHAYYVDFENKRPDYLKDLWQIVNWEFVNSQLKKAKE